MKKLLLAALLLTTGVITTQTASAQKETRTSPVPKKVLDEFQTIKANDEIMGFTYTSVTWTQVKNVFTVNIVVMYPDYGMLTATAKWNAKGEMIE